MKKEDYWFRPKKFWRICAFYYPASSRGWIATAILVFVLMKVGIILYYASLSLQSFALQFLPWVLAVLTIFDLLCFRFGEYPSWWKKKK